MSLDRYIGLPVLAKAFGLSKSQGQAIIFPGDFYSGL